MTATALLGGGGMPDLFEDGRRSPARGAWAAHLALSRASGRLRQRQSSLNRDALSSLRLMKVLVPGSVWASEDMLVWSPNLRWRHAGAREIGVPFDRISAVTVARLRRDSLGLVVTDASGGELWLWVQGPASDGILTALDADASGV